MVTEHLSQVLYDLSMQMYILFEGLDGRSIANMTNILSTYNEFRDCASLWAAFSHYNSKTSLKNFKCQRENYDRVNQRTPLPSPIERTIQIKTMAPIL